jgi:hypothetical protein
MKKYFYLASMLLTLLVSQGFAQTKKTVTGIVQDNKGKGLAGVSVSLLKAKDSSLIKVGVSENDGHFEITTNALGKFLLSYNALGFAKKYSSVFELTAQDNYQASTVSLTVSTGKLEEVTVTSTRKPMIEVKADKMVFNVESSINATGSDGLELLQKSPGIQVDNNDNISMKGKNGVKIYVDGRKLELDTKDLAAYLRSINSNDIEAIEMISNPSAKYDASGNAGIINIRLKKNKKFGTNGSTSLGYVQGITPKGNASVNLNYRDKKVNLFGNVSGNLGKHQNTLNLFRTQKDSIYDQHSINTNDDKSVNVKAGADYFIDSKNTIGVMGRYSYDKTDFSSTTHTVIYAGKAVVDSFVKTLIASNNVPGHRTNTDWNLNYRYADTSGTEVNADADYGSFKGIGTSTQPNYYFDKSNNPLITFIYGNNTPTNIDIYTAKVDAEKNFFKGKLGFGAKYSNVKTTNTFDFFNVDPTTSGRTKVLSKSNTFDYTEEVMAAYINYNRQLSAKWSIQAGLRLERTHSNGILTRADGRRQPDDSVNTTYLNLFPSAAITWNVNKKNTLNLTYSRRIDRPSYQDLNPFENKLDELTYEKGNAFLKPQYTDNIELTHTLMGFLNTTAGYSYVTNYATQITDTIGNATYVQQQNLATQQIFTFSIGSPLPIKKWWNGYANIWYNYQIFDGHINDKKVHTELPMYGAYLQNSFTLGHDYTAEMSGWYNGPSVWGATWMTKPQGGVDLGVQKQFWDKKASLKLSATDIFLTAPWKAHSDFGGLIIDAGGKWESQTLRLNFTYRFGNSQVKASRQRETGLESESKRIKGGN